MPTRSVFDEAIVQLGQEFRRRGMNSHLRLLREFYRARAARRAAGLRRGIWDEDLVIEWLCLLRIKPFDSALLVVEAGARSPGCGAIGERGSPTTFIKAVFPGGCLAECRRCEAHGCATIGPRCLQL